MSIRADITADHQWHRYEKKDLAIVVLDDAGAAVDLTAIALEWRIVRDKDSEILLTKKSTVASGITKSGSPTQNIATVHVLASEYEGTIPLAYGIYRHELWDRSNDLQLAYGTAMLLDGAKVAP